MQQTDTTRLLSITIKLTIHDPNPVISVLYQVSPFPVRLNQSHHGSEACV